MISLRDFALKHCCISTSQIMKDPSFLEMPIISDDEKWLVDQDNVDKLTTSMPSQLQGFVRPGKWVGLIAQMEEDDIITTIHHSLQTQMDDEEVAINHYLKSTSALLGPAQDMEVTEG